VLLQVREQGLIEYHQTLVGGIKLSAPIDHKESIGLRDLALEDSEY
jgi:hypothetical protein